MRSVHVKAAVVALVSGLAGCGAAPSEVTRAPVTLSSSEKLASPGEGHGAELRPVQFFGDGGLLGPPPTTPDAGAGPGLDPFSPDAGVPEPSPSPSPFGRDGGLFL